MPLRHYRLTVFVCAVSWLLVGLHLPTLHELLEHGYAPQPSVMAVTVSLALIGAASVWLLMRSRAN